MYTPQATEYDDPRYGTGHANYQEENGENEFAYPGLTLEAGRAECLETHAGELALTMLALAPFTGYRSVALALAGTYQPSAA